MLAMSLFACNMANDKDYENMAKDTCDCVNESTADISDRAMSIILESNGEAAKIQQDLITYATDDPVNAEKDVEAIQSFGVEFPACMEKLKAKYDDVYSMGTEEEVQEKVLEKLKSLKDCANAAKMMEIGLKMR